MKAKVSVESVIRESPRVQQVRGLFDLSAEKTSRVSWEVDLPIESQPWQIGLITGPSGCGKSTIARQVFPVHGSLWLETMPPWPEGASVVDGFPSAISVKEVTALLSSVGFSSPPAWLRPYSVLSTGQRFRCDLARLLACLEPGQVGVFDEYTSVVDRTVAQVGSAAVSKAIRGRKGVKFVAVTCHDDVEEWLLPDWVFSPADGSFRWRSLRPRPRIELEISRTTVAAWRLFAPHHYLSQELVRSAWCWVAWWKSRPVCFSSWLPFLGRGKPARREHRTVCLPDFQGVGIGNAVSDTIAAMWTGLGFLARSTTTHPAMIASRNRSPNWSMSRPPSLVGHLGKAKQQTQSFKKLRHATTRLTAGFTYCGPAMSRKEARQLFGQ